MTTQGDAEGKLRELAVGENWSASMLDALKQKLPHARSDLVARGTDLCTSGEGESAAAARSAVSLLVESIATLENQCVELGDAVENDNRQHRAEVASQKHPQVGIADSPRRALLHGATIVSPLGGLITAATSDFFAAQLNNERERVARVELRQVEDSIYRTTNLQNSWMDLRK